ncbi:MAG: Peptidase rane alanine aminopeptidase [Acidimicrobiales bacterium]|nr:Peptidase rane alanine aminopeptidase [Acidimicrobiales bacterium]
MVRRSALLVALVVAVASVQVAASPSIPARTFRPGAPGIGDPYFPLDGNGGYAVDHYLLDLRYEPGTRVLAGVATITAHATQDLSRFDLDLQGLTVRSVSVGRRPAHWTRTPHELVITPAAGIVVGAAFTVVVRYDGVPAPVPGEGDGFLATSDGAVAVGEPHVATTWYPVNDHPRNKATYTFAISVPKGVEAVANGALERLGGDHGWTRWVWRERAPMASYLATVAIGHFDLRGYQRGAIRYVDAIHASLFGAGTTVGPQVRATFDHQPGLLDFLTERFGPYPFTEAGGTAVGEARLGFALENQSRSTYGPRFFVVPADADSVVVHELSHQWFGDSVSVDLWKHIWLNEGFATYAEWLWSEHQGLGTAQQRFDQLDALPATSPFWKLVVGDPGPRSLFNVAVYRRGAMTLHQLRLTVGEAAFFTILRRWAADRAGRTGTTEQLIALAEQVSGRPLHDLFRVWLANPSKPPLVAPPSRPSAPSARSLPPTLVDLRAGPR